MFIVPLIGMSIVSAEYKIVEIKRESAFAGKLGQRVSEDLVLSHGDMKITVHIAGNYHTMAVHPNERLHVGDTISIRGDVSDAKTISRDRIRKA